MIKLKKILESPDFIDKKGLSWGGNSAICFGYYKNKMRVSSGTHNNIRQYYDDMHSHADRENFKYPGRVWTNKKIISFWQYPPKNMIKKVAADLESEINIKLGKNIKISNDPKYRIEVIISKHEKMINPNSKRNNDKWDSSAGKNKIQFIPLKDYVGSEERSDSEKGAQHMVSPMLKRNVKVPPGMGSRHRVPGALPGEIPAATRFRMKKGLGDNIMKLKNLIKEKKDLQTINPKEVGEGMPIIAYVDNENDIVLKQDGVTRWEIIFIKKEQLPKLITFLKKYL